MDEVSLLLQLRVIVQATLKLHFHTRSGPHGVRFINLQPSLRVRLQPSFDLDHFRLLCRDNRFGQFAHFLILTVL